MLLSRLFVVGFFLALLLGRPAAAQLLDPSFTPPTSLYAAASVYALGPLQADGKRLLSSGATRINGMPAGRLARIYATGALDQAFTTRIGFATQVFRLKLLPGGQYLLGNNGGNLQAAGLTRTELLRLNADGSADASFNAGTAAGVGNYARDFDVQPDGKTVVVGPFASFNGAAAAGVARLTASGSVDAAFAVGTGLNRAASEVGLAVLVLPSGKILVGGRFATFNGQPANGLVRLNSDGSVDATFTSPFTQSLSRVEGLLLQPDGNVLAYGQLTTNNPTRPAQSLVRVLPSGALDATFLTPSFLDGQITANGYGPAVLLQSDGKIVATGGFQVPNANRLVRLTATGAQDPTFQVTMAGDSNANAIGMQANGNVLVGGFFSSFNGVPAPLVQLLGSSGAPDPAFTSVPQSAGVVSAMVRQPDGKLVIAGLFTEINGQPVSHLARLTATGALDVAFSAAAGLLPTSASCLALQPDGKVLVGTVRGTFRFGANGAPDPSFSAFYTTMALALQADGKVLLGGQFTLSTGGVLYSRLVRVTSTGALDPSFVPLNGSATANSTEAILVQPDGRIVVAGTWADTGLPLVAQVVRYDASGALDPTFTAPSFTTNANAAGRVGRLARQPDGKIIALGPFSAVNGNARVGIARLSSTGALDPTFVSTAGLGSGVQSLAVQPNGRVLVGGAFFTSTNNYGLIRLLDDGQLDGSFGATAAPNDGITALVIQPDGAIVAAGSFTTIGGQPAVGVARIVAANVLAVAAPAAVAARTAAWPVPAHGQLHIAPDASAQPRTLELLDALGRPVRQQPATTAPEQTMSLEALPAGVYLLRVRYAAGVVTRRIAVE